MNRNAQFEQDLEQWLQTEAPASAPAGFHASVMDRARTLRQRPGWATSLPVRRLGRGRGMTLLTAAALLLVGGAFAAASGIWRPPTVVPPVPAPSLALAATASPGTTTTPTPSASPSPSPAPLGLDLTWTQIPLSEKSPRLAWVGDRFVLTDMDSGTVRTSADGQDWQELQRGDAAQSYIDLLTGSFASWQDNAIGWWNPQEEAQCMNCAGAPPITARDALRIVRPPAAPSLTTPFKGRIESLGIGPKGIVAEVHSHLDWDDWVRRKLGARTNNEWVMHFEDFVFKNGVLRIKFDDRPDLRVVWADEGFALGDFQDAGFGWYSPDGEHWTEMPLNEESGSSLPNGRFGSVVGVSDGFIATGSFPDDTCDDPNGACTGMWFSPDGLNWSLLGTVPEVRRTPGKSLCIRDACSTLPGELLQWNGGAIAIAEDGRITFWTSGGSTEFPMTAHANGIVATGPLGLVSMGDRQTLVSRDGVESKVSSLPAQMADETDGGGKAIVAVGDRTVLVLGSTRTGEYTTTPSLWLGTFEP
jgi:hypothetical protein